MPREARDAERALLGVLVLVIALAAITGFTYPGPASRDEPLREAAPGPQRPELFGVASWYGEPFRGRTSACGDPYDPDALTTAHRHLPCGTRLRVEHGGRGVTVTVTDRGPFVPGRIIDLSRAAFARLAPLEEGLVEVRVVILSR
ncbi:MAG TPA: septal ring lytic transglycosylase RlpA family protein [Actinomycetota bacterium]